MHKKYKKSEEIYYNPNTKKYVYKIGVIFMLWFEFFSTFDTRKCEKCVTNLM